MMSNQFLKALFGCVFRFRHSSQRYFTKWIRHISGNLSGWVHVGFVISTIWYSCKDRDSGERFLQFSTPTSLQKYFKMDESSMTGKCVLRGNFKVCLSCFACSFLTFLSTWICDADSCFSVLYTQFHNSIWYYDIIPEWAEKEQEC